jgi:ribosomal protein S18 acetylase RimI-like enzyme
MGEVVVLGPEDRDWVLRVWKPSSKILGNGSAAWYRCFQKLSPRERFIGIREVAFAHYNERLDGVRTLYEIAVHPDHKRQGHGGRLLRAIGFPIQFKTDADNEESNSFYRALGFTFVGQAPSRNGKKMLNHYRKL